MAPRRKKATTTGKTVQEGLALADQLHAMLTGPTITYPNPVDDAIVKHNRKYPFIESKSVLAILESDVGATPDRFLGRVLEELKYKATINIVWFYPAGGWSEKDRPFNFVKFSEQLAEHLPKCEHLYLQHMLVTNFRIESNTIKNLSLRGLQPQDDEWEVKCPNLVMLHMLEHTAPVKNFQRALLGCPRIESFFCYKYWSQAKDFEDIVPLPPWYLPNCTKFSFHTGDSVKYLNLYLPRVKQLNLKDCKCLQKVELLTYGHPCHAEWNKAPGSELSQFRIRLRDVGLSAGAMKSLRNTRRVTNLDALDKAETDMAPMHAEIEAMMSRVRRMH